VQSIVSGFASWSDQGIFFATERQPHHAVLDETSDLQSFYGKPVKNSHLSKSAILSKEYHFQRTGYTHLGEGCGNLPHVQEIVERCEKMGNGYFVVRNGGADEECEREMQREQEQEEEEYVESEKLPPRKEQDWDYSIIFSNMRRLPTKTYRLVDALLKFWSDQEGLKRIKWSDNLFCTHNFIKTIEKERRDLDEYLRIPDCLIRFQNGQVLLLSDREGAKICEILLDRQLSGDPCMGIQFGHFAFETDPTSKALLRCNLSKRVHSFLSDKDSCSIKLFNGETK
jgi:hypothetical protein